MSPRISEDVRKREETDRPTNLWKSELEDGEGKTLFEGFRSGAFTDPGLEDRYDRITAGRQKAHGVLEAILLDKLEKMSPEERQPYIDGGVFDGGTVVSLDLLSGMQDKKLVQEHHEALGQLNGGQSMYTVMLDGQPVQIQAGFDIIDFNTAVNGGGTLVGDHSGDQERFNQPKMQKLMQEVTAFKQQGGNPRDANR
jgi:hypothetical protein